MYVYKQQMDGSNMDHEKRELNQFLDLKTMDQKEGEKRDRTLNEDEEDDDKQGDRDARTAKVGNEEGKEISERESKEISSSTSTVSASTLTLKDHDIENQANIRNEV